MIRRIVWKLFKYPKSKERDYMWEAYIESQDKRVVRGRISR